MADNVGKLRVGATVGVAIRFKQQDATLQGDAHEQVVWYSAGSRGPETRRTQRGYGGSSDGW